MDFRKWYFDNDPDREFEERDPLASLDFLVQGEEKMFGKGVRDQSRQSRVNILNRTTGLARTARVKDSFDGCETHWYHHRKYCRSDDDGSLQEMAFLSARNHDLPNDLYHNYFLKRSRA